MNLSFLLYRFPRFPRFRLTYVLGLILFSGLSGCGPRAKTSTGAAAGTHDSGLLESSSKVKNTNFDALMDRYYQDGEKLFPVNATFNGDNRYNDQFPDDISVAYQAQEKAFYQEYLDSLRHYNRGRLTENQQVSYDILAFDLKNQLDELSEPAWVYMPINQIFSPTLSFAQLGSGQSAQPFLTVKDYTNFLRRIDGFVQWCDTAIGNMRKGIKTGNVLPRALVIKMLPQMKTFMNPDPKKSVYYGPITLLPIGFTAPQKDSLTHAYTLAIEREIIPAYTRLYDFLKTEYLLKARLTSGIGALPHGKKMYEYAIQNFTTTPLSPDSIYTLGLKEVARIHQSIDSLKIVLGFKGSYPAFLKSLKTEPALFPFKTDQQILDAYQKIYAKEKPFIQKMFGKTPKTRFEIRKTEDFRAKSASAEYNSGTPDGKRPGIFYTPIINPLTYSSLTMETLFLHEAIPGHHFQISLQNENTALPEFRKFYGNSAYAEGWGLYAESLGKDLGEYTDPYMLLGHLSADMHRAIRLVVDAGMHFKGWSREKALSYDMANEPIGLEGAVAEIERYMAAPGQALSYKIGALTIQALRNKYQKELGPKFKLASFHDALLGSGCLPLSVLQANMDQWSLTQK